MRLESLRSTTPETARGFQKARHAGADLKVIEFVSE